MALAPVGMQLVSQVVAKEPTVSAVEPVLVAHESAAVAAVMT